MIEVVILQIYFYSGIKFVSLSYLQEMLPEYQTNKESKDPDLKMWTDVPME